MATRCTPREETAKWRQLFKYWEELFRATVAAGKLTAAGHLIENKQNVGIDVLTGSSTHLLALGLA